MDDLFAISRGASRTVLLVGPWALKIPRCRAGWRSFLCGLLSNLGERERWANHSHPGLCPVIWSAPGGWCVIMPRVRIARLLPDEARALAPAAGYDHKASSYGFHRGELVAVDYHGDIWRELT